MRSVGESTIPLIQSGNRKVSLRVRGDETTLILVFLNFYNFYFVFFIYFVFFNSYTSAVQVNKVIQLCEYIYIYTCISEAVILLSMYTTLHSLCISFVHSRCVLIGGACL